MKKYIITAAVIALAAALIIPTACVRPAEFQTATLKVSPAEVVSGEAARVTAEIENVGGSQGTYAAMLTIDGIYTQVGYITLAAGEKKRVSFAVMKKMPGTYNVEVDGLVGSFKVLKPAEFKVSALTITPSEVAAGEPVTVKIEVTNVGEVEGSYEAALEVDGRTVERKDISVPAGSTQMASFTYSAELLGSRNIRLGGLSGTFTALKPAEFRVGSLVITPKIVVAGSPATVKADITNAGEAKGTYKATLEINGVTVKTKEVTLAGGEKQTVSFDVIRHEGGEYKIDVGGATGILGVAKLETYSNTRYGYSVSYPLEWLLDTSNEAEVTMMHPQGFPILIIVAEVVEEELILEEYIQANIEKSKSETPSLVVLSTKKVRSAEVLPGQEAIFTFTQDGAKYKGKLLYMVSGRLGFGAGVIVMEDQWDEWAAVIEAMLQSFIPPAPEFKLWPIAKLTEATIAESVDPQTGGPVKVTNTFTQGAPRVYCVFKISGVTGTKVTARWVLVTRRVLQRYVMTNEEFARVDLTLEQDREVPVWAHFFITPQAADWWGGEYKVTLYLDDEEVATLSFTVLQ